MYKLIYQHRHDLKPLKLRLHPDKGGTTSDYQLFNSTVSELEEKWGTSWPDKMPKPPQPLLTHFDVLMTINQSTVSDWPKFTLNEEHKKCGWYMDTLTMFLDLLATKFQKWHNQQPCELWQPPAIPYMTNDMVESSFEWQRYLLEKLQVTHESLKAWCGEHIDGSIEICKEVKVSGKKYSRPRRQKHIITQSWRDISDFPSEQQSILYEFKQYLTALPLSDANTQPHYWRALLADIKAFTWQKYHAFVQSGVLPKKPLRKDFSNRRTAFKHFHRFMTVSHPQCLAHFV